MKLKFTKMQGCGNDYVYINCFEKNVENPSELSVRLSDRRYGVGGDGIILIAPSKKADAKMRIFNADGSEGKTCGNGLRCTGKFLYDAGMVGRRDIKIETLGGINDLTVLSGDEKTSTVRVSMGSPELAPSKIPVALGGDRALNRLVTIDGKEYLVGCVSMGNPHCVIFCDDVKSAPVKEIGTKFQESGLFPEGVNVEFVEVLDKNVLSMRVWERGSGETLACGSGACAAAVVSVETGVCDGGEIKVELPGGALNINYSGNDVFMEGPAEKVFEGEVNV